MTQPELGTGSTSAATICNLVKGSLFTFEEMEIIGKTITSIKQSRVDIGLSFDHEYVGWGSKRKYPD